MATPIAPVYSLQASSRRPALKCALPLDRSYAAGTAAGAEAPNMAISSWRD
jgi:hypothetical protein